MDFWENFVRSENDTSIIAYDFMKLENSHKRFPPHRLVDIKKPMLLYGSDHREQYLSSCHFPPAGSISYDLVAVWV